MVVLAPQLSFVWILLLELRVRLVPDEVVAVLSVKNLLALLRDLELVDFSPSRKGVKLPLCSLL